MLKTLCMKKVLGEETIYVNIIDSPSYAAVVFTWRYGRKEWSVGKKVVGYEQFGERIVDWSKEVHSMLKEDVGLKAVKIVWPFSYPSDWYKLAAEWIKRVKKRITISDFTQEKWVVVDKEGRRTKG